MDLMAGLPPDEKNSNESLKTLNRFSFWARHLRRFSPIGFAHFLLPYSVFMLANNLHALFPGWSP
jgi:hypothetical protein